jgi:hypothetical protein
MEQAGEKIEALAGDRDTFFLLSSTAPRAVDSAKVLCEMFGWTEDDFEQHEVLWAEDNHPENLPAALGLVKDKADEGDILILVTHMEYGMEFPSYFGKREFGLIWRSPDLYYGEGMVIDCDERTLDRL